MKANPERQGDYFDSRRVLIALAVLLYTFMWIVQGILTRDIWLKNLLRPYLPDWALLVIALSAPINFALVCLRSVPWKVSIFFFVILSVQTAAFGLVGEKYRLVQGIVTIVVYLEVYLLLPRWNRSAEREANESILNLK